MIRATLLLYYRQRPLVEGLNVTITPLKTSRVGGVAKKSRDSQMIRTKRFFAYNKALLE